MHLARGGLGRNRVPPPPAGGGSISIGNSAQVQSSAAVASQAFAALACTAGSTVCVWVLNGGGGAPASGTGVADGTNTFARKHLLQRSGAADRYLSLHVAENVAGGSHTITVTPPASGRVSAIAVELDGAAAAAFQASTLAIAADGSDPRELLTAASVTSGHMAMFGSASSFGGDPNWTALNSFAIVQEITNGTIDGQAGFGLAVMNWLATSTGVVTGSCNQSGSDCELSISSYAPA